jgi:hypothetical protein
MNKNPESPHEKFPREGEVVRMMEHLLEGVTYTEIERIEKDGLLWSLRYESTDSEGDRVIFEYGVRTPDADVDARTAVIHVTFFDKKNNFVGGHSLADYENGTWKIVNNL